jgi:hypothetical protein
MIYLGRCRISSYIRPIYSPKIPMLAAKQFFTGARLTFGWTVAATNRRLRSGRFRLHIPRSAFRIRSVMAPSLGVRFI